VTTAALALLMLAMGTSRVFQVCDQGLRVSARSPAVPNEVSNTAVGTVRLSSMASMRMLTL
jgi:hypothetical protein